MFLTTDFNTKSFKNSEIKFKNMKLYSKQNVGKQKFNNKLYKIFEPYSNRVNFKDVEFLIISLIRGRDDERTKLQDEKIALNNNLAIHKVSLSILKIS